MDLNKLRLSKTETGSVLQILHPVTLEPIDGMTVTLLGQDSSLYRKLQLKRQQAALDRMAKGRNAEKLDAEKLAQTTVDDLSQLTTAWTGFVDGGKELECNPENVLKLLKDNELAWLKDQMLEFVNERANFL